MANTKTSAKRARQALRKQARNQSIRTQAKHALKHAMDLLKQPEIHLAQEAYQKAIRVVSQAGSKGAFPQARAARKISRLTHLTKKLLPQMWTQSKA